MIWSLSRWPGGSLRNTASPRRPHELIFDMFLYRTGDWSIRSEWIPIYDIWYSFNLELHLISPGLLLDLTTKGYTTDLQLSVVTWTLQACRIHWPPNIPISHSHRLDLKRSSLSFEHPSTQLSHTDQNSTPSKPRRISRRSDMSESASRQSACSHDHRQNNRKISE